MYTSVVLFTMGILVPHVFVATPAYDAKVSSGYANALLETERLFVQHGCRLTVRFLAQNIVTRARNILVHEFLQGPEYTHLMFIDADVIWKPESVIRLLQHNKKIVIGMYANKRYTWDNLPVSSEWQMLRSSSQLIAYPMQTDLNGLVEVKYAATGFMLIKRKVMRELAGFVPMWRYPYGDNPNEQMRLFFDCNMVDGEYLTEDYYFSHMYRNYTGGKIFGDARIALGHEGVHRFGSP